jgi:hypothetical protein
MDRGGASRDNAFSGVGHGGASQRDFNRGSTSDRSMGANRGGGYTGGGAAARPTPAARPSGGGGRRR